MGPAGRDFNEFGQIEDEIGYLPYGKFDLGPGMTESDIGTTHLFTGHERDSGEGSSGPGSMHQRYYSPVLARFVSIDPVAGRVESSQSWNRYSYVLGNPVKLVDPDGRGPLGALSEQIIQRSRQKSRPTVSSAEIGAARTYSLGLTVNGIALIGFSKSGGVAWDNRGGFALYSKETFDQGIAANLSVGGEFQTPREL